MAIDISKVFNANVKAIRMSLNDGTSKADILNEELFGKKKKKNPNNTNSNSLIKKAGLIVSCLFCFVAICCFLLLLIFEMKSLFQSKLHNITILKNFLQENKQLYLQPK